MADWMRRTPLPLLALLLLPAPAPAAEARRPPIDLQGVRVVDLTYAFDEKTLYWPTAPSMFDLDRLSSGTHRGPGARFADGLNASEAPGTLARARQALPKPRKSSIADGI